jgi:hypothetical protein
MLALAALGDDEGRGALRSITLWAIAQGRHPAVLDLCGEEAAGTGTAPAQGGHDIPLASIPGGVEQLRARSDGARTAVLEQLRRQEAAADLLIVRIPPGHRFTLMQAAFITGGLVVPLDGSDEALHEAWNALREIRECFEGVAVWPYPSTRDGLDRFRGMARGFLDLDVQPLDVEDPEAVAILDRLSPPPEEGFVAALLARDWAISREGPERESRATETGARHTGLGE